MKAIYFSCLLALCLLLSALPSRLSSVGTNKALPAWFSQDKELFTIGFFSAQISLEFSPNMRIRLPERIDQNTLAAAYTHLDGLPTDVLLNSLLKAKEKYGLNDYLFFKLNQYALSFIYHSKQTAEKQLTLFNLLARAGFDAQLTYKDQLLFVNVYTQDDLFEVPLITHKGRNYANLSCINTNCESSNALYIFQLQPNSQGRPFNFKIHSWPKLPANPKPKTLKYTYLKENKKIDIHYDQTVVDIMKTYPFLDEYCYLDSPLSSTLAESLLPQLQLAIKDKPLPEQIAFLAAFTRSAFPYQDDNAYFGHSKPMVPEELFGYEYSDCEDRCALFFALSKELLNLPLLVIAYDDHLSLAIQNDDIPGDHFRYNNKRYIFCDPTGPVNSSEIGQIPNGYQNRPFEIIFAYP